MHVEKQDEGLRELFCELRAAQQSTAPPFSRVWHNATTARSQQRSRIWVPAATGAAVVVTVVLLMTHLAPVSERLPTDNTTLSQWQSPTAFLLDYTEMDLFREVPTLGESLKLYDHTDPT